MNFLELLESAPSNAGYLDIKELMRLYYGRLGIFVSFSNSENLEMSGFDGNVLARPYGIVGYSIDTVVGRKVGSASFYAHVFRNNRNEGFLKNIRDYNKENFKSDFEALKLFSYLDEGEVEAAKAVVEATMNIRFEFQRFWQVVRVICESEGKMGDKLWRRILLDLGYTGFNDPSGLAIMSRTKTAMAIYLEERNLNLFDIVPVQRFRKDRRQRVINAINRKNRLTHARRNRIAKAKTDKTREKDI
jgi:hypothetical protein